MKKLNLQKNKSVKEQLPIKKEGCNCETTYVVEKINEFTGKAVQIRICCLAREVEKISGKDIITEFTK